MKPPPPRAHSSRYALILGALAAALWAAPSFADTVFSVRPEQGAAGIQSALAAARRVRQGDRPPIGPLRIVLEPGEYALAEPLRLDAADGGTEKSPLVIESRVAGAAVITGGPRLTATNGNNNRWTFSPVKAIGPEDERTAGQFYVNGQRATLAREPNAGTMWLLGGGDGNRFTASAADFSRLAQVVGNDSQRALVHLMQSWTSGRHHLAALDADRSQVLIEPKPRWAFNKYGPRQRYYVENLPGALDAPGEWIAQGGRIHYLPTAEDRAAAPRPTDLKTVAAYWPRLSQLLLLQGTAAAPVEHVTLRGLAFAYTGVLTPSGGWIDNQAATGIPAAIELNHARRIVMERCELRHLGGYGLWLRQGVSDTTIKDSVLTDLGAGGIRIGTETTPSKAERSGGNRLERNVINRTGRDFPGAVAVWIGRSFGNRIAGNIIAHTSYTGISLGWSWGFEEPTSGDNLVEDNVLFNIGEHQLSDLGAIYTLGRSPGTVIRGNFIREVRDYQGYGAGAWGIYNDEGSTDILVENNVVIGTRSGGYQLHYGRDLIVRGNLFAQGGAAEVRWANVKRSGNWRFEGNGVEMRPGRPNLQFHNSSGSDLGDPDTLSYLQAGKGSTAVQVMPLQGLTDVRLEGPDEAQLAGWRKVIANAAAVLQRSSQGHIPRTAFEQKRTPR